MKSFQDVKSFQEQYLLDRRKELLMETDWYILRKLETGVEVPQEILDYRQALRDISQQQHYPNDVVWPTKPE